MNYRKTTKTTKNYNDKKYMQQGIPKGKERNEEKQYVK